MMMPSGSCFFIRKLGGVSKDFACNELFELTIEFLCEIESSLEKEIRLQYSSVFHG